MRRAIKAAPDSPRQRLNVKDAWRITTYQGTNACFLCAIISSAALWRYSCSPAHKPPGPRRSGCELFKVVTVKDEIVIGLSADELKALGGTDASAVAHALAQKGDLTVWQYNVHRGPNGELQQAPTAKIGLLANSSLRVEPYTTPYAIVPHQ